MRKKKEGGLEEKITRKNLQEWQKNLSTALGAVNFILLDGTGDISEAQRKFLSVARRNLQKLFDDFQECSKEKDEK